MMKLTCVQMKKNLGTNTMMMMVVLIFHQNNHDTNMMLIRCHIINDNDLCPLEPEDYDGDRDALMDVQI